MFFHPAGILGQFYLMDLSEIVRFFDRNGKPDPPVLRPDFYPLGIAVLGILDVVEKDKDVGCTHFLEIPEIRQIIRLMNCYPDSPTRTEAWKNIWCLEMNDLFFPIPLFSILFFLSFIDIEIYQRKLRLKKFIGARVV